MGMKHTGLIQKTGAVYMPDTGSMQRVVSARSTGGLSVSCCLQTDAGVGIEVSMVTKLGQSAGAQDWT